MNRKQFIRKYAEKCGTKISETDEILINLEYLITELISAGETIKFHGFCEIGVKEVNDRIGTNPQNSEIMTIKGGKKVYVKIGTRLKSAVEQLES